MKYRIREQNELKPSGVEWLGDIPKDWKQKKIKYLFNIGRGRVIAQPELEEDGIYPVYSSQTKNNGVLGYIKTYDFDCKQLTWTTDGANAGTVFLREGKHNCTNVCGTLQQKNDNFILKYLLFALQKVAPSYKRPDTNGAKIMNGEMAEIKVTFPSKIEQQKIANFLDEKSKFFDEAISKKEQLILKLELAKQSLISEVVTGKLKIVEQNLKLQTIKREKNELKPSGVEWLGDIPNDWKTLQIKHYGKFQSGDFIPAENINEKGKYHVFGGNGLRGFTDNFNLTGKYVLIGRQGALCGNINFTIEKSWVTEHAIVVYNKKNIDVDWLGLVLKIMNLNQYSVASAQPGLSIDNITKVRSILPTLIEQQKIAKYLDEKLIHFDNTIEKTKQSITKLKEAKEALISQAVTGKIEVL